MKKVVVTGCSGYLGSVLCRALLGHPLVERVVGVDLAPPKGLEDGRFRFRRADVRDEFLLRSLFEDEGADAVYHLAFVMGEPKDEAFARGVNVGGTLAVLEAANKCPRVKKLVFSGSASAYGARRGNPERLREEDPLRAATLRYGVHKRVVEEELAKALPSVRRDLKVVMLRICTIVGRSDRSDGPVKTFCALPAAVSVLFHAGALQFIAEEDLMRVMTRALEVPDAAGAYNVAPDDVTTIAELARALGKPRIPLPYFALWLALWAARRLGGRADLTENVVGYLAYPVALSNEKLKRTFGVRVEKGSLEAFLECARALAAAPGLTGPERPGIILKR